VSDGGVHSHLNHLLALTDMCNTFPIQAYVHAFLDGRDTDPKSGFGYLETILNNIEGSNTHLATIVGRYYAMDRDNRWERTKIAYDLLVHGIGETTSDPLKTLQERYELNETDEFVMPISINNEGKINDGDVVVFFNFRTDRPRQLTQVLSQTPNEQYNMQPKLIKMVTMTEYDASFKNIDIVFHQDILKNTLGEVVTQLGLSQVRIAETEKYPHVTYFFSGGREQPFEGEERIMIPSPKVATYDLQPEMSAYKVKEAICDKIDADQPDFICLNFANADMVGHTGVFSAAVKAVEVVDECLNEVVLMARSHGYEVIIIADHGNADYMVNSDGSPNTAHTKNPVPCIYVGAHVDSVRIIDGILADIAPTLAGLMEIDTPDEMTGKNLIQSRVQ
jgi:2,3-bisphosphoglycerate-independent phosphoglycerate mutase